MASETLTQVQAKLTRVQTAIAALETDKAQSYSISGRSFTRLDLQVLYDRERELLAKIARIERGGGIRVRLGVPLN